MATVELTADSIAQMTDEERVRYNTLVWKANAIPAIQLSMYHSDPMISYLDGWSLVIQMRQYFEAGGGRDLFGSQQQLAVDALTDLEEEALATVESVGQAESVDKTERFVYRWAESHPLTNNLYLRESAVQAVAEFAEAESGAGLSALGSLTETAAGAQQMALVLASYAPKQVSWLSELLIAGMMDSTRVGSLPWRRSVNCVTRPSCRQLRSWPPSEARSWLTFPGSVPRSSATCRASRNRRLKTRGV